MSSDTATMDQGGSVPRKIEDETASERLQIVATPRWLGRIDDWRRKQRRIPSRSEVIRIAVDAWLEQQESKATTEAIIQLSKAGIGTKP